MYLHSRGVRQGAKKERTRIAWGYYNKNNHHHNMLSGNTLISDVSVMMWHSAHGSLERVSLEAF